MHWSIEELVLSLVLSLVLILGDQVGECWSCQVKVSHALIEGTTSILGVGPTANVIYKKLLDQGLGVYSNT
jgi:hypothetical protein